MQKKTFAITNAVSAGSGMAAAGMHHAPGSPKDSLGVVSGLIRKHPPAGDIEIRDFCAKGFSNYAEHIYRRQHAETSRPD